MYPSYLDRGKRKWGQRCWWGVHCARTLWHCACRTRANRWCATCACATVMASGKTAAENLHTDNNCATTALTSLLSVHRVISIWLERVVASPRQRCGRCLSHNPREWCDLLKAKTLSPSPKPARHSRHSEPGCIPTRLRVIFHTSGPHNLRHRQHDQTTLISQSVLQDNVSLLYADNFYGAPLAFYKCMLRSEKTQVRCEFTAKAISYWLSSLIWMLLTRRQF